MKALIKKVLPRPVLHSLIQYRDQARLRAVPKDQFHATPLRPRTAVNLEELFAQDEIAQAWAADHAAIRSVFGDDDRFGGINPGDRRALYSLIAGLKPQRVLEVGTHIGASTLYIARALKGHVSHGRVTTVDILDVNDPAKGAWRAVGLNHAPRDFANQLGCLDRIEFVAQPSLDYMKSAPEPFDFIFLDGDHTAPTVYREIAAALKILRPGGVILLHDYYPDARPLFPDGNIIAGPFQAARRIVAENPEINMTPLGNLPWPTKQGSHSTSLALVTRAG